MTIHLSADTLHVLTAAKTTLPTDFLTTSASPRASRETRAVVTSLLSQHITRPLKSQAFLEHVGAGDDFHVDGPKGE